MKEKILEYLKLKADKVGVTPPELIRAVDGRGDCSLSFEGMNQVYIWGASAEFLNALQELIRAEQVWGSSCSVFPWLVDGFLGPVSVQTGKPVPLAKQDRAYKTEHWCPVLLDLYDGRFANAARRHNALAEVRQSMTEETQVTAVGA
jgi:hypothetical protein